MLLRFEASFAMMRVVFDSPFIAAAGWLASGAGAWDPRLGILILALVLARGASNVINDVADLERDRVTNPWLPLPSGIVNPGQALATLAVLAGCVVGLVAIASPSRLAFAASVGLLALGGALVAFYSLMPSGPMAIAVASTPFPILALIGWTLGEGRGWAILPVLASSWLYGAGSHLQGAVRDVDADAESGRRTVAVRYGPVRCLHAAACCDAAAIAAALVAAAGQERLGLVFPLAALSLGVTLAVYRDAIPRQGSPGSGGRFTRVKDMRALSLVRLGVLVTLVAAFSTWAAVALALVTAATLPLLRRHERRVVSGALRRRMFV